MFLAAPNICTLSGKLHVSSLQVQSLAHNNKEMPKKLKVLAVKMK